MKESTKIIKEIKRKLDIARDTDFESVVIPFFTETSMPFENGLICGTIYGGFSINLIQSEKISTGWKTLITCHKYPDSESEFFEACYKRLGVK